MSSRESFPHQIGMVLRHMLLDGCDDLVVVGAPNDTAALAVDQASHRRSSVRLTHAL